MVWLLCGVTNIIAKSLSARCMQLRNFSFEPLHTTSYLLNTCVLTRGLFILVTAYVTCLLTFCYCIICS